MPNDAPQNDTSDAAPGPQVQWRDDVVPFSSRFEDTYFSDVDGRAETGEVFLGGNGLPARWSDGRDFVAAELGFGTGLNFLETVAQWRKFGPADGTLRFVSFEKYPLECDEMLRALSPWPEIEMLAGDWLEVWPPDEAVFRQTQGDILLEVHVGDARTRIGATEFAADAWYLDGFSPAQNPELWDKDLLRAVFERTVAGGTFSTYTAAGWVRRNLQAAGFEVRRVPGFGRKRERLQGVKPAAA